MEKEHEIIKKYMERGYGALYAAFGSYESMRDDEESELYGLCDYDFLEHAVSVLEKHGFKLVKVEE